jgi:hypothetical protein
MECDGVSRRLGEAERINRELEKKVVEEKKGYEEK